MKKFKKILALALSLAMVLGMSVTTFASSTTTDLFGDVPSSKDNGKITVTNLKAGDTVDIYKIVKANYTENGFTGYESVHYTNADGVKTSMIADVNLPTANEIAALLTHIEGTNHADCDASQVTRQGIVDPNKTEIEFLGLEVGTYLVKVTAGEGSTTVYNPMVASVYYVTEGTDDKIENGTVDADSKWDIQGDTVYAKSSDDNDITKTIVDSDRDENSEGYGKGDDVAAGTTVSFAIEGTIPSYDKEFYTSPVYKITDTLSDGLDFVTVEADAEAGTSAKTAQEILQEKADEIFGKNNSSIEVNGRMFTLTVKPAYLQTIAGYPENNEIPDDAATSDRTFKFVYSAVLNGSSYNFDPSTNTAKVTYSNKPATDTDAGTTDGPDKKTYHYTFSIGARLTANDQITTETTNIIQKIDSTTGKILSTSETVVEGDTTLFDKVASGAVFELKHNTTGKVYEETTDENGQLIFEGLDAGEYTLKETKAPAGYSLSNITYPVVITPTYNEDGQLTNLEIKINNESVMNFSATYESGSIKKIVVAGDKNVTKIPNTKLSSLPSTGGIGTTIFTIGGCAIMILAAALYFASRRKTAK